MKYKFLLPLVLILIQCNHPDLECKDFRTGKFKMTTSSPIKMEWEMERSGNNQIEIINEIPKVLEGLEYSTTPKIVNIEWIDDCNYKLLAENTRGTLDSISVEMNEAGGVLTELVKIKGRCFYYRTTNTFRGEKFITTGKLCKI